VEASNVRQRKPRAPGILTTIYARQFLRDWDGVHRGNRNAAWAEEGKKVCHPEAILMSGLTGSARTSATATHPLQSTLLLFLAEKALVSAARGILKQT
jgi:hypothetical protein